jgi:hypothetical protein
MFEGEDEDRKQGRGKAAGHMLAIATLGIAGSKVWVGGCHLGVGEAGLPRDKDQGTGSGDEENGIGNELRNKPVMEVAQTITVPGCRRSGMMFVEPRRTRILTEGNSQFYTQPEAGHVNDRWLLPSVPVVPSECASIAPSTRMSTVT